MKESIEGEKGIVINWDRSRAVLGRIMDAYRNGDFPYNQDATRLPQDPRHMPSTLEMGTKEHAMYLFTTCLYMRGGIRSDEAFRKLSTIYDKEPGLFVAEEAAAIEPATIAQVLTLNGLGFARRNSEFWVENSTRLKNRWDGDPRNIYKEVQGYEDCLVHIANDQKGGGFKGFQEKMVSMITYYLMEAQLIPEFTFPLPVDLHVLRVTIANEMVLFPGYEEGADLYQPEVLAVMRELYHQYAIEIGGDTLGLCNAVWMLSQSLCGINPGNVTLEPEGAKARKGRSTVLVPLDIDTNSPAQNSAYDRSCRSCPVEDTCEWNLPSKPYYVSGILSKRSRRTRFPGIKPSLFNAHSIKRVEKQTTIPVSPSNKDGAKLVQPDLGLS